MCSSRFMCLSCNFSTKNDGEKVVMGLSKVWVSSLFIYYKQCHCFIGCNMFYCIFNLSAISEMLVVYFYLSLVAVFLTALLVLMILAASDDTQKFHRPRHRSHRTTGSIHKATSRSHSFDSQCKGSVSPARSVTVRPISFPQFSFIFVCLKHVRQS